MIIKFFKYKAIRTKVKLKEPFSIIAFSSLI